MYLHVLKPYDMEAYVLYLYNLFIIIIQRLVETRHSVHTCMYCTYVSFCTKYDISSRYPALCAVKLWFASIYAPLQHLPIVTMPKPAITTLASGLSPGSRVRAFAFRVML